MFLKRKCDTAGERTAVKWSGKLIRLAVQLGFYLFEIIGIAFFMFDILPWDLNWYAALIISCTLMLAVFLLTFNAVYKLTGSSYLKTVFIQGGGIFTVIHIVLGILLIMGHEIYMSVKESFVIPNFTEQQICAARSLYNWLYSTVGGLSLVYAFCTVLPLVISSVIWFIVKKRSQKKVLNEIPAE